MTSYRLWPSVSGPSAATGANSAWLSGVIFSVTGGMRWLQGYWWWVCNTGQTTTAQKFALWNRYSTTQQNLIPAATVTSGALTAGQWNYVQLSQPVQLAPGALYVACTGWTATGIPLSTGQFGSGGTYAAGIVNGPLTAWSAQNGSNVYPAPTGNYNLGQGLFSNALGADPSVAMPNNGSGNDNFWLDVQVSDTAPAGYAGSYRLRPNQADVGNWSMDTANGFTLGLEFSLSQACAVNNAWFYSPAGVTQLPTAVGVYRVSDQSLVAVNSSPSWSGAAASGWVKAALPGTLQPGVNYKVAVFQGSNVFWNGATANYWSTGFGANGLVSGPITAPSNASATSPGQESYNLGGAIGYPNANAGPYDYGLDIELTPVTPSGLLMASGII